MSVNKYNEDEKNTKFSFQSLKRAMKFVKPYKFKIVICFLIGLVSSFLIICIPKIMSYIIDNSFVTKNIIEIVILCAILLLIIVVSSVLIKWRRDKLLIVFDMLANDLKVGMFCKLQYLPNSYFDNRPHGKIFTRLTSYADNVSYMLCYKLIDFMLQIISLIFVVIFMFSIDIKLSLVIIILAIILLTFSIFIGPIKRKKQHIVNNKYSNINAYLSESINGIRITQSFNRESKNNFILEKLEKERHKAIVPNLYLGGLSWVLSDIFMIISNVLVYFLGLNYFYPALSIGSIIALAVYSNSFWQPIRHITSMYNELTDTVTYLERILELLDEEETIAGSPNALDINVKGNIQFKNVSFGYNENKVLELLNFNIKNGEKIGIVGESGSGKSTILNLIMRFYDIENGQILLDSIDIKDLKLNCLRKNINIMVQDNYLFERSIIDNICLDKIKDEEKVCNICKKLGLDNFIRNLKEQYDTLLFNNGSNLSSGERQLVCIARIMYQDPKVLILDEATSNIDMKTELLIDKALKIVSKGRTTIIVAHRLSTVQNCDRLFLIKDKHIYEEGSHEELLKLKGEYYKLYSRQSIPFNLTN